MPRVFSKEDAQYYNQLKDEIHQWAVDVGWWSSTRSIETLFMLMATEVAEATEGLRKGLMDDHLTQYPMEYVELADVAIRLLDFAGSQHIKFSECSFDDSRFVKGPESHFELLLDITSLYYAINDDEVISLDYAMILVTIEEMAEVRNFNLREVIKEKMLYNRKRADHKKENREKEGGKKF